MLPSTLDPRGRTIRRIGTSSVDEQERLVLVKRRALAAKSVAVSSCRRGPDRGIHGERPQVSVDDFEYLKVIGVGAMARVLLVRCRHDGELYAMKVTSKHCVRANRLENNVVSERDVLGGTDHPSLGISSTPLLHSQSNLKY
jgi:serine/threonine protein kinase